MSDNGPFNVYGKYYDLLYSDKDYAGEVEYLVSLLNRFGGKCSDVLELGSGTGKHARLLVEHGYQVTGIERSPEMIALAENVPGFDCCEGDIRDFSLDHYYDAVVSLFHVMSYQTNNYDLLAVFQRVTEHLKVGGLFIFDAWFSPAVISQQPESRVKYFYDNSVEITRKAEPRVDIATNTVDVTYTITACDKQTGDQATFKETHSMRHFSIPEIELIAKTYGFNLVAVEQLTTGLQPSYETWAVCFVLMKV